jgi:diguanylate cyclase (GGDEF)-like protein
VTSGVAVDRLEGLPNHHGGSVGLAIATTTAMAVYDVAAGPDLMLAGLLTVGPCLAAASARWRAVLAVGGYAVALLAAVSGPDRMWWTRQQLLYLIALLLVTGVGALLARRQAAGGLAAALAQAQLSEAFEGATIGMALVSTSVRHEVPGTGLMARAGSVGPQSPVVVNAALARLVRWTDGPAPQALRTLVEHTEPTASERTLALEDGSELNVVVTVTALSGPVGGDLQLVQVEDVTVERQEHAALAHLALHDHLTGLAGRALLQDRLDHALQRARRGQHRVGVLYVDMDGFKHTNDSLGHEAGDHLLLEIGRRLASAVRPGDTVARIGGDEFVVLLDAVDHPAEAEAVAERMLAAIREPAVLRGQTVYPSASIGIALSHPGAAVDSLLRDSDTAMYRAKGRGRARAELFGEHMRAGVQQRLALESGLHQALDRSELRVHLQPIVELATGRMRGAEALVRWERPGHGLVPPGEFIPVAEDSGLIRRIDAWVLDEAVAQTTRYRRDRDDAGFSVSVNVSAAQLADARFPAGLAACLERHGPPPANLVIEVTESVYAEAVGSTLASLATLRDMRVRLALDDFGTGYSSLTYIKQYPFDILKIDRSFVRGLLTDPQDDGIVQGVIGLAQGLGLTCVAEGVESPAIAARLDALGCELGQGFTWSRAVTLGELSALPAWLVAR